MVSNNTDSKGKPIPMTKWEKAIAKQNENWLKREGNWRQTSINHKWNCEGAITRRAQEAKMRKLEE